MKVSTKSAVNTNNNVAGNESQTDKPVFKESIKATNALSVIAEATKLIVERKKFETEELARSNKALYALLTKVYGLFKSAVKEGCIQEAVIEMRNELKKRNVKVQSNTPAITVFVRFIFNSDRKRAYNYASTLMAAAQAEIEPAQLAAFIEGKNGVEECKKEFKKKDETRLKEEALAEASLTVVDELTSMKALRRVTIPNASVAFSDGVQFAFIVARSIGKGEFELLQAVPKSTKAIQNAAVKELAKYMLDKKVETETATKHAAVQTTKEKAVKSMTAKDVAKMTVKELETA
jgi:hypothetical protein